MVNLETKRLLKIKEQKRKKKPSFKRIESWRYKRVNGGWRAAKGIDSDTRQKLKSGVKSPNVGYRTPKKVRGLHPSGLKQVVISNIKEIEDLKPHIHGIMISSKVGTKKRMALIEEIQQKKFKVLNYGLSYVEDLKMKELLAMDLDEEEEKTKKSETTK